MDRQSSIDGRTVSARPLALFDELLPPLIAILLALQLGVALVLVMRRLQGAMTLGSSPTWPVAWMLLAAGIATATRGVWRTHDRAAAGPWHAVGWYVPLAALLLTALALTSWRTSFTVSFTLWAVVAIEEVATALWLGGPGYPAAMAFVGRHWPGGGTIAARLRSRFALRAELPRDIRPALAGHARSAADTGSTIDELLMASAQMAQRFERLQSAEGRDVLAGVTTMRFSSGQVTAHVHVAFCPPFARVPQIDHRQVAGPAARLKVGQVLPHGVRFDVKLDSPAAEGAQLRIEIRATHEIEKGATTQAGNDLRVR